MRKNEYNKNVLMITKNDFIMVYNLVHDSKNELLIERFKNYINLINEYLKDKEYLTEVGLLLHDNIDKLLGEFIINLYNDVEDIQLEDIKNAYIYASLHSFDNELKTLLKHLLINFRNFTRKNIENQYESKILYYILNHRNFDTNKGFNTINVIDKKIMLCHDGILEETILFEEDYERNRKL